MHQRLALVIVVFLLMSGTGFSQTAAPYAVPRTVHGHPDFQGIWVTDFLTPLERFPRVEGLVASPDQAQAMAATIRSRIPDNIDPQVLWDDLSVLTRVKGEYRTSVIVVPEDGRMPYTPRGGEVAARVQERNEQMFDAPEQRPLMERCLENFAYPPIRPFLVFMPHQIFQADDHVLILSEGPVSLRMIHLHGDPPPGPLRSFEGHSIGRWEGDTLVVTTTHLRDDDPARLIIGRPILLGPDTTITERFIRVSETELFYQFTIEDEVLYTQPWTGEFSLTLNDGPIYEYACHEGNYSMPTVLRGGQTQASATAADPQ